MALIKCPECKQDVSDKATFCPHCGYPFEKIKKMHNLINAPKPKDDKWTKKWENKPSFTCGLLIITFVLSLIMTIIFIVLAVKEVDETDSKLLIIFIIFSVIIGLISFLLFIFAIMGAFVLKVKIVTVNNYNIVAYCGFFQNCLIIEDELVETGFSTMFHNAQLTGKLPNGKKIVATISSGAIDFELKK